MRLKNVLMVGLFIGIYVLIRKDPALKEIQKIWMNNNFFFSFIDQFSVLFEQSVYNIARSQQNEFS